MHTPASDQHTDPGFRHVVGNALRYWEMRRVPYNLVLVATTVFWCAWSWPHFRPALTAPSLLKLLVLALLASAVLGAAPPPVVKKTRLRSPGAPAARRASTT